MQRVTKEQAIALKEIGYDVPCAHVWNNHYKAGWYDDQMTDEYSNSKLLSWEYSRPTLPEAFEWFREVHGLYVSTVPNSTWTVWHNSVCCKEECGYWIIPSHDTHSEAESAGMDELIKIVKARNNAAPTV